MTAPWQTLTEAEREDEVERTRLVFAANVARLVAADGRSPEYIGLEAFPQLKSRRHAGGLVRRMMGLEHIHALGPQRLDVPAAVAVAAVLGTTIGQLFAEVEPHHAGLQTCSQPTAPDAPQCDSRG